MTLYIDTETQGLPDMNKRASDPCQPHLVQFAAIVTSDTGEIMDEHNVIVRPDGWEIPADVSAIHGITTERAMADGLPESMVAKLALMLIKEASLVVAHNLQFDKFLIRIALRRHGLLTDEMDQWWKEMPTFCTMKATTNMCKLPGKRGVFKWPKLIEAYRHAFGEDFDNQHDALADVKACARLHRWITGTEGFVV